MAPQARQKSRKHMMKLRTRLSTFQALPKRAETQVLGKIYYLTLIL